MSHISHSVSVGCLLNAFCWSDYARWIEADCFAIPLQCISDEEDTHTLVTHSDASRSLRISLTHSHTHTRRQTQWNITTHKYVHENILMVSCKCLLLNLIKCFAHSDSQDTPFCLQSHLPCTNVISEIHGCNKIGNRRLNRHNCLISNIQSRIYSEWFFAFYYYIILSRENVCAIKCVSRRITDFHVQYPTPIFVNKKERSTVWKGAAHDTCEW